tara:strand:+ start:10441 stop:11169 length:729 start_codon:yes stop_codon:yes gene_type:complete
MELDRIRRKKYFVITICISILQLCLLYICKPNNSNESYGEFYFVFAIILTIIGFRVLIQRLHDVNLSGWYSLLALVPIINFGLLIPMFRDGTIGPNEYGEDPKKRIPKKHKASNDPNNKISLLKKAHESGILTTNEFERSKNELTSERESEIKQKMLTDLYEAGLISKYDFELKLSELPQIDLSNKKFDPSTLFYYASMGKEHGPISVSAIIKLVNSKKINGNCFIRTVNNKNYIGRAKELR